MQYTMQQLDQAFESARAAGDASAMQEIDAARQTARAQIAQQQAAALEQKRASRTLPQKLARVGGLAGRDILEGIGGTVGIVYDPIAALQNTIFGTQVPRLQDQTRQLSDYLGLPQPETRSERVSSAVGQAVAGGGGLIGAGRTVAARAAGPVTRAVATNVAAQPALQGVSSATGGAAAQTAREEGYGPLAQLGAGLLGGLAPTAGPLISQAGRVVSAARANVADLSPELARLLQSAEQAGVTLKTTDIMPLKTWAGQRAQQIGEAVPIVGTGSIAKQQAQQSEEAIANIAKQYAADLYDPTIIYGVAKSLESAKRARIAEQNARVSRIIGQAEKKAGGAQIEFPSLPGFVKQRREQELALGSKADPKILATLDNIEADVANLTPTTLEAYRKRIGEGFKNDMGVTPDSLQRFESALYGVLRQDQGAYIKKYAGDAAFNEWKVANNAISNTLRNQQTAGIANMLNKGEISPDAAFAAIVNAKDFKSKALYNALDDKGRLLAQSAIINNAAMKATGNESLVEGVAVSVPKFVSTLKQSLPQIRVFFRGKDRQQLEGLIRVLDMTKSAGANIKTGYAGIPLSAGGGVAMLGTGSPLGALLASAAAGTGAGAAARVYESPAVRDLLIKLAKTPKGSTAERVIGGRVAAIVNAAASANRTQEQPQEQTEAMQ